MNMFLSIDHIGCKLSFLNLKYIIGLSISVNGGNK